MSPRHSVYDVTTDIPAQRGEGPVDPTGCQICGDPRDHEGEAHSVAMGDGKRRLVPREHRPDVKAAVEDALRAGYDQPASVLAQLVLDRLHAEGALCAPGQVDRLQFMHAEVLAERARWIGVARDRLWSADTFRIAIEQLLNTNVTVQDFQVSPDGVLLFRGQPLVNGTT